MMWLVQRPSGSLGLTTWLLIYSYFGNPEKILLKEIGCFCVFLSLNTVVLLFHRNQWKIKINMQILVIWEAGTNFTQMKQTLKLFSLWEKSPVVLFHTTLLGLMLCVPIWWEKFLITTYTEITEFYLKKEAPWRTWLLFLGLRAREPHCSRT